MGAVITARLKLDPTECDAIVRAVMTATSVAGWTAIQDL
jgi:hypothetical protein